MSSRSRAADSRRPSRRRANTSTPKGQATQKAWPLATSGWTKRSSSSVACVRTCSSLPRHSHTPTRPRRGCAATSNERRTENRMPG